MMWQCFECDIASLCLGLCVACVEVEHVDFRRIVLRRHYNDY
jgi:hypothetical protein